ncbi:olfactory receptor 1G1 [Salminus brasiliensis]|uniref:olfactory receptor 1G1 n=1 Tax=Salminus brasiliensis TaxID=930266 RepID=UPI003B82F1FD
MALNRNETCPSLLETINTTSFASLPGLEHGHCLFTSILPSETAVHLLVLIFVALIVFSLLVNVCALLGLGRSEDLSWEPRFTLLKNLILSDLLLILSQGPTIITCLLMRRTLPYGIWCLIQYFLNTMCIFCTILTITCMALERYLYVCQAIYYLHILTSKRLHLIIGLTWLLSLTISTINVLLMSAGHEAALVGQSTTGLLCEPDTLEVHLGFPRAVAIFRKVSGFTLTMLCILSYSFSYFRIYQEARNAVQPFQQVNRRARNTVLFYCSMFLLQLLPVLLKIVTDALWELEGTETMASMLMDSPGWTPAGTLHIMLLVLLQVPPCINPLIYGLRNQEVRQSLPRLIWWRKHQEVAILN